MKTKYLFIELSVQDGERQHTHLCLHATKAKNLDFVAQRYAAQYWGESYRDDDVWYAHGGEIAIRLTRFKELTKAKYLFLHNLFY